MSVLTDPAHFLGSEVLQDPYPTYRRMREDSPVQRLGDSDFFVVCGWDALTEALGRADDFSSNLTATLVYRADGSITPFDMAPLDDPSHALATADDPAHALHRKILLPHLSARRIRDIEVFAVETARRLWVDNLIDGRIEWMGAVANRLPMMVVARLIGVPDDDVDQLIDWAYATTTMLDGIVSTEQLQAASLAAIELAGCVQSHFARVELGSDRNILGDMASRCASGELADVTAMNMMLTLFGAGGESTASLLGSAMLILTERPDVQRSVRDDPGLIGAFIEETLRYEPPFRGHYRHVKRDTTLAGVALPADSHLLLLWGAANRDPAHVEAPDEFRLGRHSGKDHVTFGKGIHFCVGAALARLEARIVLEHVMRTTRWIEAESVGAWLPSILVRRVESLQLSVSDA